jgi:hypothetical protein
MADRYEAMFLAAVQSLAEISKALGIPDDEAACANGNDLILARIAEMVDSGECRSCVNGKCVTGPECVTLGRDTLTDEQIDLIVNDGMRNAAGGIYATRVYDFARAVAAHVSGVTVRFDGLHEYAERNRLDYNELCRVVRDALGVTVAPDQTLPPPPPDAGAKT